MLCGAATERAHLTVCIARLFVLAAGSWLHVLLTFHQRTSLRYIFNEMFVELSRRAKCWRGRVGSFVWPSLSIDDKRMDSLKLQPCTDHSSAPDTAVAFNPLAVSINTVSGSGVFDMGR